MSCSSHVVIRYTDVFYVIAAFNVVRVALLNCTLGTCYDAIFSTSASARFPRDENCFFNTPLSRNSLGKLGMGSVRIERRGSTIPIGGKAFQLISDLGLILSI